jgi:hypothetical protein
MTAEYRVKVLILFCVLYLRDLRALYGNLLGSRRGELLREKVLGFRFIFGSGFAGIGFIGFKMGTRRRVPIIYRFNRRNS